MQMRLFSAFLVLALSTSAALAGDLAPLSPGAPAGVKRAQTSSTIVYGVLGAGAIAGFLVALTSGSNSGPAVAAPTTTSIASTAP
jgi:hypothetical protein